MNYYNKETNFIQSTPATGLLEFPDEFMPEFYKEGKRAAGFVTITDDGHTVTSCVWNEAAYLEWCLKNPENDPAEPAPTLDERIGNLEEDTAELHEALDMILSGVTE